MSRRNGALQEPRKHSRLYDDMTVRLIAREPGLKEKLSAVGDFLIEHKMAPHELTKLLHYLSERNRWNTYVDEQAEVEEEVEVDEFDEDDEEGFAL